MAMITTYLLVSGPEEPEEVAEHALFEEYAFEHRETVEPGEKQCSAVRFVLQSPLEEAAELEGVIRQFSTDMPEATVVLCELEERFDQIERLQMVVFRDGKRGGEVEHGYIYNVGPGE